MAQPPLIDNVVYHIYAKDVCLYNCLSEDQFNQKWKEVKAIVGLIKTDYTEEDITYIKCPNDEAGHHSGWKEPAGDASY